MIHDLDQSLEALLTSELSSFGTDRISVSFSAPDAQFSARLPAIDLFLYDLRENLELRSNDESITFESDGRSATRRPAPARIDASYLVTAWPGGVASESVRDEHRLLGATMLALLRHRKLPVTFLKGSLLRTNLPLPVTALQPGRLQSVGEFWQALGGKPKAALNYMVTFLVDVFDPETVLIATDRVFKFDVLPDASIRP